MDDERDEEDQHGVANGSTGVQQDQWHRQELRDGGAHVPGNVGPPK